MFFGRRRPYNSEADVPAGGQQTRTLLAVIGIVIAGGLIITTFIVQTVRTARSPVGKALALFREVKHNEHLARKFGYRGRVTPFKMETWLRCKRDIAFLPEDLQGLLNEAYEELARLNEAIGASVERHQESHLNTVNTAPIREDLGTIRQLLDVWTARNLNNPDYAPRRPRFLWFG